MRVLQIFLSVDSSLGRVDYTLMSDQTLMEMLIDRFDEKTKRRYKDSDGMYLDVRKWPCVKCDDHQRVMKIEIESSRITGTLELCYVPPKVIFAYIRSQSKSRVTGSVDLKHLPEGIQELDLQNNNLTGKVDLVHLPSGMVRLFLQHNQLSGEVDLAHLPQAMRSISLNKNKLTGEIDLTQLPKGLLRLSLENNQFSGSLVIRKLPGRIHTIYVRRNNFNAIAVVESETDVTIELEGSGVTSVVDENGRELDMKRFLK